MLLSTCRNQWMAANAAFADIQPVLLAGRSRSGAQDELLVSRLSRHPVSLAAERLESGASEDALQRFEAMVGILRQARVKLEVWERREQLTEEFEHATTTLPVGDAGRMRRLLAEQRSLRRDNRGEAVGRYLALSTIETSEGRVVLQLLAKQQVRLAGGIHALLSVAQFRVAGSERSAALAAAIERPPTLMDAVEPAAATPDDPWPALSRALTTPRVTGEPTVVELLGLSAPPDAASEQDAYSTEVIRRAVELVESARSSLSAGIRPNRPRPALPPPFLIDVTPAPTPTGGSGTRFGVTPHVAGTPEPPASVCVGLLRCGVPQHAYAEGLLYQYDRSGEVDHAARAREIAEAAVRRAASEDVAVVVMPECFVPYDAADELAELADELGVTLIAGVEHVAAPDGRIVNAAVVCAPGLDPVRQRKQRPSVYEAKRYAFACDGVLRVFERTPLGTLGVMICSDYLELDILWALASHEPRIDSLIVPARNPNPDLFLRVAAGDALRLHANVIVANADPGGGSRQATGEGSIVAWPERLTGSLTEDGERMVLDASAWDDSEIPSLAVFSVTVAALAGRMKGRTDHGLAAAPAFVTETPADDGDEDGSVVGR